MTSYFELVKNKQYILHVMLSTLAYTIHFVFIITSANIFINFFGFTPVHFGYLMFVYGAIYFLSGLSTIGIVKKFSGPALIKFGGILIGISSFVMLLCVLMSSLNAWQILLPMTLMTVGITIVRAAATTGALTPLAKQAGQGSAGLNLVQFLLAAIIGTAVTQFINYPHLALTFLAIICAGLILITSRGITVFEFHPIKSNIGGLI